MRFNPKARLDNSRVRDVGSGGSSGGMSGGRGIPIPMGKAGGGIGGVILIIALVVLAQCSGIDLTGGAAPSSGLNTSRVAGNGLDGTAHDFDSCQSGADANASEDCTLVALENSLYNYWGDVLGDNFEPATGVYVFTGGVTTQGCGSANSEVGPFYCPADQTIYLDTSFFKDVLEGQLGGKDAPFVRAYVIAHEYGHHIQNILGTMNKVRTQQGPNSDAVKLELQADCYAGMWTQTATSVPDSDGNVLIQDLTNQDIADAIDAAATVGDDYIQNRAQGRTNPEGWTHGSSAQRMEWFETGMRANNKVAACDTGVGR